MGTIFYMNEEFVNKSSMKVFIISLTHLLSNNIVMSIQKIYHIMSKQKYFYVYIYINDLIVNYILIYKCSMLCSEFECKTLYDHIFIAVNIHHMTFLYNLTTSYVHYDISIVFSTCNLFVKHKRNKQLMMW